MITEAFLPPSRLLPPSKLLRHGLGVFSGFQLFMKSNTSPSVIYSIEPFHLERFTLFRYEKDGSPASSENVLPGLVKIVISNHQEHLH